MEAPPGFEPGIKDLQSSALPLGYGAAGSDCPEEWCGVKALRQVAGARDGAVSGSLLMATVFGFAASVLRISTVRTPFSKRALT